MRKNEKDDPSFFCANFGFGFCSGGDWSRKWRTLPVESHLLQFLLNKNAHWLDDLYRIPLINRELPRIQAQVNAIQRGLSSSVLQKRQSSSPLTGNTPDILFAYHGSISIGSPPTNLSVLFDTGSYQLWVRSANCTSQECQGLPSFNSKSSSTFKGDGKEGNPISYVDGTTVKGLIVADTVSVAGITVQDQSFQLAIETNERTPGTDGIMGLAFSPTTADPTFWESAVAQKRVPSAVFSYYIDATDKAGALTLGGMDLARYSGPLAWIPILPTASSSGSELYIYWQVGLTKVTTGSDSIALPLAKLSTIFDTGTSLAIFPLELAAAINKNLGLSPVNSEGTNASLYGISCPGGSIPSGLPDLTLTFDNIALTIPPSTFMFLQPDTQGRLVCLSGIAGVALTAASTDPHSVILGNILLRQFYTVFDSDARQIGISNAYRAVNVESKMYPGGHFNSPNGTSPVVTLGGVNAGPRGSGFCLVPNWFTSSLLLSIVLLLIV